MASTRTPELEPFNLINLADGDDAKVPTRLAHGLPTNTQRLRLLARKVNEIIEHVKRNAGLINATRSDARIDTDRVREMFHKIKALEDKGPTVHEGYYTGGRKTRKRKKKRRKTKRKRVKRRRRTKRR
jgi:hypothetical protein